MMKMVAILLDERQYRSAYDNFTLKYQHMLCYTSAHKWVCTTTRNSQSKSSFKDEINVIIKDGSQQDQTSPIKLLHKQTSNDFHRWKHLLKSFSYLMFVHCRVISYLPVRL